MNVHVIHFWHSKEIIN